MREPAVEYVVHRPPPPLDAWVARCVGYRLAGFPAGVHVGMPSRFLTVVVSLDDPVEVARPDGRRLARLPALAGGLDDAPVHIPHGGDQHGLQLALTPAGARALLGRPAADLAGLVVPLDDVLGPLAAELQDRLRATPGWPGRLAVLDRVLMRAAATCRRQAMAPGVEHAFRRLAAAGGALRVDALARELGWSRRHLAGRVRAELGLPPKVLAEVMRFERSHRMLASGGAGSLAGVAAACGYADQAHMAREWRRFAGASPTRWLRGEVFPSVQDAAPARA